MTKGVLSVWARVGSPTAGSLCHWHNLGTKKYYLGIFFKANWYKAEQYCRFHGMHLASINSGDEQKNLEEHIQSFGMGHEHFWTSGTDQAEEGKFFWMSTGKPMTYENWNAGEPNNFQYENGEQEHCLELWNRDGKGLRWNDTPFLRNILRLWSLNRIQDWILWKFKLSENSKRKHS